MQVIYIFILQKGHYQGWFLERLSSSSTDVSFSCAVEEKTKEEKNELKIKKLLDQCTAQQTFFVVVILFIYLLLTQRFRQGEECGLLCRFSSRLF